MTKIGLLVVKLMLLKKRLGNKRDNSVVMQQFGKHASTTVELLLETVLCNSLLSSCNMWTTTMETGVFFYVVRAEELS
jgi:hypothetical protein